tara:strand:- start:552 stop:1010 length:459 start_codon:yes stop_codon:yes gene_type:complete
MNKIILTKLLIVLFFVSGCGYSPIFSSKNSNFSIIEIGITGNNKINNIINNKLNNYKNSDGEKTFSLNINTNSQKNISSKNSKGDPKTFNLKVSVKISIKDSKGNLKEKLFIKSVNYKNLDNKFNLKKYEEKLTKNLAEIISDEIIIYLQSI